MKKILKAIEKGLHKCYLQPAEVINKRKDKTLSCNLSNCLNALLDTEYEYMKKKKPEDLASNKK